ncbi:YtxH domain-containing protein [Desulfuromonas thiophila]|uniref:Uncharacterized protein n=1 Tax=Desulfuromonas thiophila TaxID=57664 RepID=A0A1G6WZK5_9BACT|nr:YtxH domain-containing protein [Desulfuromonas thiophila]SDD71400.1 hypothetical protein SAMN05661003_10191 [Desulfuromonas thiophila]
MQPPVTHSCSAHQPPAASAAPVGVAPAFHGFNPAGYNGPVLFGPPQTAVSPASPAPASGNSFWLGALVGAGAALLLSNDRVQKSLIRGTTALFSAIQASAEELKEKFEDVRAEMSQSAPEKE